MQITSPRTLHQQYFKQNIMHHNSSQRLKNLDLVKRKLYALQTTYKGKVPQYWSILVVVNNYESRSKQNK